MKALTYAIYLTEPVLATQAHSGEPNSATSYPFVPGSMIRGALIGAFLDGRQNVDLPVDEKSRRLFFSGDTLYLNAYPMYQTSAERMLPTPLSWLVAKDEVAQEGATVYDFAIEVEKGLKKSKPPRGTFCYIEETVGDFTDDTVANPTNRPVARLYTPDRQVNVHNASRNRNEKKQGESQVYRYDALAAGQTLIGVILSDQAADLEDLKSLLEDRAIFLGGSHTGGYGRVEIRDTQVADWRGEYPSPSATFPEEGEAPGTMVPSGEPVIITLLSDTILQSPAQGMLNLSEEGLGTAVAVALGIDRHAPRSPGYRACYDLRVVGGFNRKWGLPLPQDWALQSGSVFRFPAGSVQDVTKLARAVFKGIGERNVEGFGRVAVNWQHAATLTQYEWKPSAEDLPPLLSAESTALAERMANRLLRRKLETALAEALSKVRDRDFRNLPAPSQLSRVRLAARQTLLTDEGTPIAEHMDGLTGARADRRTASIGDQPLFEWIRQTSHLPEGKFKEQFSLTRGFPKVAGVEATVTDKIRREYCARLVDGVMKLAIETEKRRREAGGQ